ncbi:hypothetical protein SAMN04489712_12421 [Thermomonospora echinospora]|uniref:CU044_5270 family protein n=1 Tax=Thermomonospora echinospora TaxID=1992 RepID=A0A1H6DWN2_9ACTN|nr:CU044_5270 family protein [Thermomonospora echinospora]SEG89668.1 hypothetical protein SAMN04489712_12421 [Thermomonospora echinospora]
MDEITMVRELYGSPEPDPAARERIRARVVGGRPVRRPHRRMTFGLGLVAAATAVVAGASLLSGGTTRTPVVLGTTGGDDGSARSILLAAADSAEKEQPGRYWRLHTTYADTYRVKAGYNVEGNRWESDRWMARSKDEPDHNFDRDLPSRPQTPADEAAWRRAGSPKTWKVISSGRPYTLTTESTGWRSATISAEQKRRRDDRACGDGSPAGPQGCNPMLGPSTEERVLTDPGLFRKSHAELRAKRVRALVESEPHLEKEAAARFDLPIISLFLTTRPASPQVRAAAFRLLADTPGIRSIGTVTDRAGRRGIGLAARATKDDGGGTVYDEVLILEPKTYRILGEQQMIVKAAGPYRGMAPGTVLSHTVVHHAGWTDAKPAHP